MAYLINRLIFTNALRLSVAVTALFFSVDNFAWRIDTSKGAVDAFSENPNSINISISEAGGAHGSPTLPNKPVDPVVLPQIYSADSIPKGTAIEIGEGEYLTSEGIYKKLENGAYLTPEGIVIETKNGLLLHLQDKN